MAVTTMETPNTSQDLIDRLGNIPLSRVLMDPLPGHATEADLIEAERRYHRLYELVDGTLVEKAVGFEESVLATVLIEVLRRFVVPRNLGVVTGARRDGSPLPRTRSRSRRGLCLLGPIPGPKASEGADSRPRTRARDRGAEPIEHAPRDEAEARRIFRRRSPPGLGGSARRIARSRSIRPTERSPC